MYWTILLNIMQDYKLLNQICSFRQNVTPFLKRDTSTRCDVRIEPSDLQFQGSTNLISHQPNDLDWALCRPGQAGLGHNRRSEWGGHIFKGKMNIIKMITATDYGRPVRKSPSLHGRKSTPTPKFLGTAEAYFVCHIGRNFQISLIHAFIGCP